MCIIYNDRMRCGCVERGVIRCRVSRVSLPDVEGIDWSDFPLCEGVLHHAARNLPMCARHAAADADPSTQPLGDVFRVHVTICERLLVTVPLRDLVNLTLPDLSDYLLTATAGEADDTDAISALASAPSASAAAPSVPERTAASTMATGAGVGSSSSGSNITGDSSAGANSSALETLLRAPAGKIALDMFELDACAHWLGGGGGGSSSSSSNVPGVGNGADTGRTVGDLRLADVALGEVLSAAALSTQHGSVWWGDSLSRKTLREISAMTWVEVMKLAPLLLTSPKVISPAQASLAYLGFMSLYEMGLLS